VCNPVAATAVDSITLVELEELQRNWDEFGKRDPLWAIRTCPDTLGGRWDVAAFFRSGDAHVAALVHRLDELEKTARRSVLDFGCGVGRLSQAFATRFDECWGVDIAPSMIERAREFNRHGERVHYVVNDAPDLSRFPNDRFDLVFSFIVLQHIRPELSIRYIRDFFRVCAPGGAVVFQLPSHIVVEPLPRTAYAAAIDAWVPKRLMAGDQAELTARVRNVGSSTWDASARSFLRLGNHWLAPDGRSVRQDDGRAPLPHDVAPGQSVEVSLPVTTPIDPGRYVIELDMVQEHVGWFADRGSGALRAAVEVAPSSDRRPWVAKVRRFLAGGAAPDEDDEPSEPVMEMHAVPRQEVLALVEECGGVILAVELNDNAPPWESYMYYATKPATVSRNEA